jgi:hypothetical protein
VKDHARLRQSVAIGIALIITDPSLAQAPAPFESAPAPETPKPKPRPRVPQPSAIAPVAPAPAATAPTAAAPTSASIGAEVVESRNAPSGVEALVDSLAAWDNNCAPRPMDVRIVEPPRNGAATIRDGTARINTARWGSAPEACRGREIAGKQLYYQSKPGFRGADRVGFLASFNGAEWHRYEIRITVE